MIKPKSVKSQLEELLALELTANKIPFQREFRFHQVRRWRYDFLVGWRVLVDVQGGLHTHGKHSRPQGYANDAEKMHAAQALNYRVIYATKEMIQSGRTIEMIKKALCI